MGRDASSGGGTSGRQVAPAILLRKLREYPGFDRLWGREERDDQVAPVNTVTAAVGPQSPSIREGFSFTIRSISSAEIPASSIWAMYQPMPSGAGGLST